MMEEPPPGGRSLDGPVPAVRARARAPIDPGAPLPPRRLLRGSEKLAGMLGRRLLVGISYLDAAGEPASTQQFCGRVLQVGDGVVVVERPDADEPAVLPADAAAYRPAPPGQYRLNQTGELVIDPDFITTWRLREPNR